MLQFLLSANMVISLKAALRNILSVREILDRFRIGAVADATSFAFSSVLARAPMSCVSSPSSIL